MSLLRPLGAIVWRELLRTLRQRGRLLSALVRPLIWLLVIGTGLEAVADAPGGYRHFLVPGLLGMTLLFGAMLASLSLVYDKESGVMRMLLVAPVPHAWLIASRITSAALAALLQALLLIAVLLVLGFITGQVRLGLLAAGLAGTALACAAIGMLVAVWVRTLDNFAVVMNLMIFPIFFVSGALYPLAGLVPALRVAASLNPFSYGVDFLKHALPGTGVVPDFALATDAAVLGGFTCAATTVAALRFASGPVLEALAARMAAPHQR